MLKLAASAPICDCPGTTSLPLMRFEGELAVGRTSLGLSGFRGGMFFDGRLRHVGTSIGIAPSKPAPKAPLGSPSLALSR